MDAPQKVGVKLEPVKGAAGFSDIDDIQRLRHNRRIPHRRTQPLESGAAIGCINW